MLSEFTLLCSHHHHRLQNFLILPDRACSLNSKSPCPSSWQSRSAFRLWIWWLVVPRLGDSCSACPSVTVSLSTVMS